MSDHKSRRVGTGPEAPQSAPFTIVNTFVAVEGGAEALVDFQLAEMRDMSEEAAGHGWLGNEVYRSQDGTSLIVVTRFRSEEARDSWTRTDRSRRHVRDLMRLVKDVASVPVTFLAAHGESPYADDVLKSPRAQVTLAGTSTTERR